MLLTSRAVSVLLVGLLTACSGSGSDQEPAATPTPTASSAASGGPAPLSAAEQEAVQAAVVDYFEGYDRAFETGDAAQLAAGSDPSCPCRGIVEDLERALADGGSIEGNRYSVGTVIVGQAQDDITAATAVVSSTAGRQLDADGQVVRTLDAQVEVTKRLLLTKRSGDWKVLQVG